MFPQLTAMQALLPAIIALVFAIVSLAAPAPRVEDQDLRYLLEYDATPRFGSGYMRRHNLEANPEAAEMRLGALPDGERSPRGYLDNYRILPPVKRLSPRPEVRSRSILCYFNSVSCFGTRNN